MRRIIAALLLVLSFTFTSLAADAKPDFSISKAKSIKKDKATVTVVADPTNAPIHSAKVVYYTKKNNTNSVSAPTSGTADITINGLSENTKYYYYLSITSGGKTYETSARHFVTKEASKTTTSESSKSVTSPTKAVGTNTDGPGTDAIEDTVTRNAWKKVEDKWLYFGADGFSKTGWYQVDNRWYYTTKGTNELAMSQWKEINDVWYCFDSSGAMIANAWVYNDGWYWLGSSGSMLVTQDIEYNGSTYILGPDGRCLEDKLVMRDNSWLYCKPGAGGIARSESITLDGKSYWADESGHLRRV